ncbi:MAG: 1,6-anhydro-N-acetylmuramyl-L-alanine amidase AmpD [Burkholderiaceae bacterium]|nr:1,6-anhydro-N-acetylmuramyl-L-alanine amidase AmpD [Burkholderiaceae bacterium]
MGPFRFSASGWLSQGGRVSPSPHCDARPAETPIDLLVVHNISLPAGVFYGNAVEDLFLGRLDCASHPSFADLKGLRVSSHFFIRRQGEVIQFVGIFDRAWHAGISEFQGRSACNDFSIGIELEGTDQQSYTDEQLGAAANLATALHQMLPTLQWIVGHSDIAPGRKTDPGPAFPWQSMLKSIADRGCFLIRPTP